MTDAEFVDELVVRLNLWLEADGARANKVLLTPLTHAAYANVGHLLSQFCFPRGVNFTNPPEAMDDVRFLVPMVGEGRITAFQSLTGAQMQEHHRGMQERAAALSEAGKPPQKG